MGKFLKTGKYIANYLITKGRDPSEYSSYKDISLLSIPEKVYGRIIIGWRPTATMDYLLISYNPLGSYGEPIPLPSQPTG